MERDIISAKKGDPMRVTSAEFKENYEAVSDKAFVEPVTITGNGGSLTLVSTAEFERLKRRDRRVIITDDLSDEDLALIANSRMSPEHDYLDAEIEDWKP